MSLFRGVPLLKSLSSVNMESNQKTTASQSRIRELVSIACLLFLYLAGIAIANPFGNFPINDDWIYGSAVSTFAKTGQMHLLGTNAFDFIPLYLAGFLSKLAGFSFDLLRFTSIAFHLFGTVGAYLAFRELSLAKWQATLFASVFALNPFMVSLSLTFMTDVPALALTNWMFYFAIRAFQKKSLAAFVGSVIFLIAAMSVRQTALAFFPCIFFSGFIGFKTLKQRLILALSMLSVLLSYLGLHHWVQAIITVHETESSNFTLVLRNSIVALLSPLKLIEIQAKSLCYLGLFVFPITIPLFALAWQSPKSLKKTAIASTVVALMLTLVPALYLVSTAVERAMPYYHNLFSPPYVGSYGLIGAEIIWPAKDLAKLDIFCAVVATLCSFCIVQGILQTYRSIATRSEQALTDLFLLTSLAVSILAVFAQILANGIDRYFLMVLAPVLLFFARIWVRVGASCASDMGSGFLSLCLFIFGTVAACDHMNFERTKWQAIRQVEKMGVDASCIDGGPEYNLITGGLKHSASYVHTNAQHGWSIENRGGPVRSRLRWWPVDREDYVVSCYFLDDFHVIGKLEYWSPFRWKNCPIYILEADALVGKPHHS